MSKRNRASLVPTVCRNCGTHTLGRWCHNCGQDLFAGRNHKLREIVGNSLGTIFALDNKVLRTLWYLVALPGRLTNEFYAGRIVRYVFPSKLFWFITIIFFALVWSTANVGIAPPATQGAAADSTRTGIVAGVPAAESTGAEDWNGVKIEAPPGSGTGEWFVNANGQKVGREEFMDFFSSCSPYMMLALIPVFALLVMLFFWRRERSYSDYLVFALHFHSFFFLLLTLGLIFGKIFPDVEGGEWILLCIPPIWLGIALRSVLHARIVPMIFKILLLGFVYLILMAVTLALFVIVFLVFIKNIDIFA